MNRSIPSSGKRRPKDTESPRSPLRVMQALEELAICSEGLSLTRLSERMKTPKTSLLNLLRSLESGHYVELQNGSYRLGANALRLGAMFPKQTAIETSIPKAMRPFLEDLMKLSGETALLGVICDDNKNGVYIDIVEGNGAIRFSSVVGTQRPLYCSAFGKTLLAFIDSNTIQQYLNATPLVLPFKGLLLQKKQLLADLNEIRRTRLSISHEEISEGAGGIAAPIFSHSGKVACVLSVAAPIGRLRQNQEKLGAILHGVAERACLALGFNGRYLDTN